MSLGEILVLLIIGVIFIGPKELPVLCKFIASLLAMLKAWKIEITNYFNEISNVTTIIGDDGKEYEAFDIADLRDLTSKEHKDE